MKSIDMNSIMLAKFEPSGWGQNVMIGDYWELPHLSAKTGISICSEGNPVKETTFLSHTIQLHLSPGGVWGLARACSEDENPPEDFWLLLSTSSKAGMSSSSSPDDDDDQDDDDDDIYIMM